MPALNSKQPSAIRETVKALCAWILANTDSINQVYDQFPAPGQVLDMPCVSVHSLAPKFTPMYPWVLSKGTKDTETGLTPINKVVGMYDFILKVDLWCAYKPQRDAIYEEIFSAFAKNSDVMGIDLRLTGYFNEYVHYTIQDVTYVEDEASAQRNEWRAIATVLVNVRAIQSYSLKTWETIENNLSTPDQIDDPSGSSEGPLL